MSDGQLKFDTKVDTSGVKKGTSDIKRELGGLEGVANKVKATLQKAFKLNKKDTQIDLNYSAQHPQSFFKGNIEDELFAIESINKELVQAKSELARLQSLTRFGNVPDLQNKIQSATNSVKTYELALQQAQQRLSDNQQWLAERIEIDKTKAKVDELQAKLDKMNSTGVKKTSQSYKNLNYDLNNAKNKLDVLMHGVDNSSVKVNDLSSAFDKTGKSAAKSGNTISKIFSKKIPKSVNKSNSSLKYFGRMISSMLIMSALFGLMKTFTEGMQDMAKVCPEVNKNLSGITTSLSYLKNSFLAAFSPLLGIVQPVIDGICNALAKAMNYISMFLSFLTGKSTYKVAVKQQKDYAASLEGTGSAAKSASKSLASFDEINQLNLQNNSGGGGGTSSGIDGNTFVDKQMPNKQSVIAETIKKIWDGVGRTFDNLGNSFMKAWNSANNGVRIMNALHGIVMIVLNGILQCVMATEEWAKKLNFSPLLSSFATLLESLMPLIQQITDLFTFLYINAILPIAQWMIEEGLPAFLDVLSGAISVLNSVIEALKPLGIWLWDNFLDPMSEWTGGMIVSVLKTIGDVLQDISDWINENQVLVQDFVIVIGSFATVWGLVNTAITLWNAIGVIATGVTGAFAAAVAFLTSPIGLVVTAIGALIAIVVLLAKHWDEVKIVAKKCWDGIVATFSSAWQWFDTNVLSPLTNLFKGFINGILGFFESMANGIIGIFENIVNFFVEAINSIGFDLPDILGGGHIGFDLSPITLGRVSLPRLATGTVIPPNVGEFAAILGDNNRETEVVSPLSTIKEAVAEVMSQYGNGDINLRVSGSMSALIRLLKIELDKEDNRVGRKLVKV